MPQAFANVPRVGWGKVQSHPSWDSLSYSLITTFQYYFISGASLVAQLIKNPPAIWKTWVRSLGSEDPLEKGKATHSSILAWRIPWTIQSMGLQRVGHDWVTFTFTLSLSGQFSHSVMSDSLWPHELQHTRPPCPSPTPGDYPNSCYSVMPSNHLIPCCPLLLPSIFPSIRVFSNESSFQIRWPKYWSFSFNIRPSNEYPGLMMDGLDLLSVQGTLKSLLQHHSSKASILQRSAFFIVQLSHPYMTTGKTTALTTQTFVDKVMSLLFNMLSRLVITFLPRSKHLLISWLQSPSAELLEPPKNKVNHCFPIYLPWSDGTGYHDLSFLNVEL